MQTTPEGTGFATSTWPRLVAKSPGWSIARPRSCGAPGGGCITPGRLWASVAILIIRGLADKLQQRAHGGPRRALQSRLRMLAGEFEKGAGSFDAGGVLKTGASLVRRWRGHTHAVLVGEDGFEYDGQRYRSLTVIAERITGAHWSGPRFFGVNQQARAARAEVA